MRKNYYCFIVVLQHDWHLHIISNNDSCDVEKVDDKLKDTLSCG